jgi:hypothetical protein
MSDEATDRLESETASHGVERSRAPEETIIAMLLAGRSVTEISETTGLSRTTLWRIRKEASFQERLQEAREQALEGVVAALHENASVFARTLVEVCQDEKARGSEKATAARSGLEELFKSIELFAIETRLRRLEELALEESK